MVGSKVISAIKKCTLCCVYIGVLLYPEFTHWHLPKKVLLKCSSGDREISRLQVSHNHPSSQQLFAFWFRKGKPHPNRSHFSSFEGMSATHPQVGLT